MQIIRTGLGRKWGVLIGFSCLVLASCVTPTPERLTPPTDQTGLQTPKTQARPGGSALPLPNKPLSALAPEAEVMPPKKAVAQSEALPLAVPQTVEDGVLSQHGTALSDENDFAAVSDRQTIESDAARLARNSEAYQVIEPGDLPKRDGSNTVNIVEFALNSDNLLGSPVYSRFPVGGQTRFLQNCSKYPSSDIAQIEFLKRGGPKRDILGLDPDGDGFACFWDPLPFRQAVGQ